jgi:hypothetical protein
MPPAPRVRAPALLAPALRRAAPPGPVCAACPFGRRAGLPHRPRPGAPLLLAPRARLPPAFPCAADRSQPMLGTAAPRAADRAFPARRRPRPPGQVTKHHPSSVDLELVKRLVAATKSTNMVGFLTKEFDCISRALAGGPAGGRAGRRAGGRAGGRAPRALGQFLNF